MAQHLEIGFSISPLGFISLILHLHVYLSMPSAFVFRLGSSPSGLEYEGAMIASRCESWREQRLVVIFRRFIIYDKINDDGKNNIIIIHRSKIHLDKNHSICLYKLVGYSACRMEDQKDKLWLTPIIQLLVTVVCIKRLNLRSRPYRLLLH